MKPQESSILIVFGGDLPKLEIASLKIATVVAPAKMQKDVLALGVPFAPIEEYVEAQSIYEADALLQEMVRSRVLHGESVPKVFNYHDFELWWIHYGDLFYHFCLPYTRFRKLLEYARGFKTVYLWDLPFPILFNYYFEANGVEVKTLRGGVDAQSNLPFGVLLKIVLTLVYLPVLALSRRKLLVFTSDKFEKDRLSDFRQRLVYEELEKRGIPFTECIRGLESWRTVLDHALKRGRAVLYSDTGIFIGRFFSAITGGRRRWRLYLEANRPSGNDQERFIWLVATHYLRYIEDDAWSISINRLLLRLIGTKVAYITAATERSLHTVIACKLEGIPTVGIMHGVASRYGTPADFMPGFSGPKKLSVDFYGVWSEWWKSYYAKESSAYTPEQLHVSGPMRPQVLSTAAVSAGVTTPVRVLFIAEQTATHEEVMPYLHALIEAPDIKLTIKFRPSYDGFEEWLRKHEPKILALPHVGYLRGGMQEAIEGAHAVIGCHSTGVLESLLQLRVPIFIRTRKWGDYYKLAEEESTRNFFAKDPQDLLEKLQKVASTSRETLEKLRERYFGDPEKNGSRFIVDELERLLRGVGKRAIVSEHEN